ncbi:MAG: hypothetical protein HFE90_08095 [Firmicutes bacterium]|nr:hypothetical protein [Bacillota bacterium]
MARPKKRRPKARYINKNLKLILQQICDYPVTFIGGPAGCGKSTLAEEIESNGNTIRICASAYEPVSFFCSYSGDFQNIAEGITILLNCKNITRKDIEYKLNAVLDMRNLSADEIKIIIDDFHNTGSPEYAQWLYEYACNLRCKVHFIILSRENYWDLHSPEVLSGNINLITPDMMLLNEEDIVQYYNMCGIHIDSFDASDLYEYTEGWINALYLIVLEYMKSGRLKLTYNLQPIFCSQIKGRVTEEEERFIQTLSLMKEFTIKQAEQLMQTHASNKILDNLCRKNIFIFYNQEKCEYKFMNIFREAVIGNTKREQPEKVKAVLNMIGDIYCRDGLFIEATDCYYQACEYEKMMSAMERGQRVGREGENISKYIAYYNECPREIRSRHHLAVLYSAWRFFNFGKIELYTEASLEFLEDLYSDINLSEEQRKSLLCDYSLFKAMTDYADLDKIKQDYENAFAVFDGVQRSYHSVIPRTFGNTSVLKVFYSSGRLDEALEKIEEISDIGSMLTDGGWRCISRAARAEAFYMRMRFDDAEIMLTSAKLESKGYEQLNPGVLLCASFTGVQVAFAKGDYNTVISELKNVFYYANQSSESYLLATAEACKAWILVHLGVPEYAIGWLKTGIFDEVRIVYAAQPSIYIIHLFVLLGMKKYTKLLGYYDMFFGREAITDNNLIKTEALMLFACACCEIGKTYNAREYLIEAMKLSESTENYMAIVVYGEPLISIINSLSDEFSEQAEMLVDSIIKFIKSRDNIRKKAFGNEKNLGLTRRESQVARCVGQGMINREIAAKLSISENTVKSTLQRVFSKLGITSRRQIAEIIKNYDNNQINFDK